MPAAPSPTDFLETRLASADIHEETPKTLLKADQDPLATRREFEEIKTTLSLILDKLSSNFLKFCLCFSKLIFLHLFMTMMAFSVFLFDDRRGEILRVL